MNSPELYACLYVKEFAAQALLRLRPELREKPYAVMEGEPPLQQVCSLNAKARRMGVLTGMTHVEMEAFPAVTVLQRSMQEEAATRMALLECAGSFTPRVEEASTEMVFLCVLDIRGTEKLFGPAATLAEKLKSRVKVLGITASVAISRNFHAAICLARGMAPSISTMVIPAGAESAALASLPLSVLALSEEHAEKFALWGIRTLGMLASLPEKDLIARMGQEGKSLRQLALGKLPHLFLPVEPSSTLEEYLELDSPVEILDSLLFVVGVMLEQLIMRATSRMLALAALTIVLRLEGGSHTRTVRPALPTNDRQFWIKLLHLDLEAHPPKAPIISLTLAAEPGSSSKVQLGLFSPQLPVPGRLDVTLARIRAIVGEECVGRAVLRDTHQPQEFRMEPFAVIAKHNTAATFSIQPRVALRQFRPPENIPVTLQNERPASFFLQKKRYIIEKAYGPWCTSGDWWNPELWNVEQWDIVAYSEDGSLLCGCIVRDAARNCWDMVALYD